LSALERSRTARDLLFMRLGARRPCCKAEEAERRHRGHTAEKAAARCNVVGRILHLLLPRACRTRAVTWFTCSNARRPCSRSDFSLLRDTMNHRLIPGNRFGIPTLSTQDQERSRPGACVELDDAPNPHHNPL